MVSGPLGVLRREEEITSVIDVDLVVVNVYLFNGNFVIKTMS